MLVKVAMHIGYSRGTRGYKLWDVDEEKVVVSRDVRFDEGNYLILTSKDGENNFDEEISTNGPENQMERKHPLQIEPELMSYMDLGEDTKEATEDEAVSQVNKDSDTADLMIGNALLRHSTRQRKPPGVSWSSAIALLFTNCNDPTIFQQVLSGSSFEK